MASAFSQVWKEFGAVFRWVEHLGPAGYVLQAIFASLAGIGLLLTFILGRRAYRRRYLHRRDVRTLAIRQKWEGIVNGTVPPETWRFDPLDCDIVESILLDQLDVASPEEAWPLIHCLHSSGLVDMRAYEARYFRGWRRRKALLSLGRMRVAEGIPALAEALHSENEETRVAAVRGLGRIGLPGAAIPILDLVARNRLHTAIPSLQNALLSACRPRPGVLLPYVHTADDASRPLLARVLSELATADMGDDLLELTYDPLAEVRACAARALGRAKSPLALTALANLARDPEWFVRLRAVVALGELNEVLAIPVLVTTLCDSNRYVRLRSASVLAQFEGHLDEILEVVRRTGDRYALQALISELQRSGALFRLVEALLDPNKSSAAAAALLAALRAGSQRMLLDAFVHHAHWRVRLALARLLAQSGETALVPELEALLASTQNPRQKQITRWLLRQLAPEEAPVFPSTEVRA